MIKMGRIKALIIIGMKKNNKNENYNNDNYNILEIRTNTDRDFNNINIYCLLK